MLRLTCIFLATVGIGGALGLFGLDGTALEGARIVFYMCLALSVLSIFMGRRAALQFRSERRRPAVSSFAPGARSHGPAPRRVRAVPFELANWHGNPTSKMVQPVKQTRPTRAPAPRGSSAVFIERLGMRHVVDGSRHNPLAGDLVTLLDPRRCMT
jgi:uncharacterized membrane protein YtjA (UPF0391 family)